MHRSEPIAKPGEGREDRMLWPAGKMQKRLAPGIHGSDRRGWYRRKDRRRRMAKKARSKKALKKAVAEAAPIRRKLKIDSGRPAEVLSSKVSYEGPLFRVQTDVIREPNGKEVTRDVIRHGGSAVILAIDRSKSKKDPLVLMERQFRHAAQQYLYELPAGKMDPGESHLEAAKRELLEETGYQARKWNQLVKYYASPGFLGEWHEVFLAEDLTPGMAQPEEDESIELQFVPLSRLLRLIDKGQIQDGKTMISVMYYVRSQGRRKK
jgi:ADP-ribose pyrophosphatase